jgi:hypothetical protein
MMIKSIRATYELDGEACQRIFEGKGTTHKIVKTYLRSLGATKIKTEIIAKAWYS